MAPSESEQPVKMKTLAQVKRDYIEQVLKETGGNKTDAARILGIDRRTLLRLGYPKGASVLTKRRRRG